MLYQVHEKTRRAGNQEGKVVELIYADQQAQVDIWLAHGFNCLSWKIKRNSKFKDLLYQMNDWEQNPVPTRSGIPILFPFPNRLRDGFFVFSGKEYHLPKNDSSKSHGMHGYAARYPWRLVECGADHAQAWVTGEFRPSIDAPEVYPYWPSDYRLRVTYRLKSDRLVQETQVYNPSDDLLPFGLGFHPYFRFPCLVGDTNIARARLTMPARSIWQLEDCLPTGKRIPVPGPLNWIHSRMVGDTTMDTLYTDLQGMDNHNGLQQVAELRHADFRGALKVWVAKEFREMVLFTPVHRQAICIEPYTCPTDYIHLHEQGLDSGITILPPGETWMATVEYQWDETATDV